MTLKAFLNGSPVPFDTEDLPIYNLGDCTVSETRGARALDGRLGAPGCRWP